MTRPSPRRLRHAEVEAIRHSPGRSMLLFVTDRCPVGCLHCSVDSRSDSPTITDFELFGEILEWLCERSEIEVMGISGGEPFVERRGLQLASRRFAQAGKRQVIFTSGVWAKSAEPAHWIAEILGRTDCVYLSTDTFHSRTVDADRFVNAARTISAAGCWIVVQVLDHARSLEMADAQLVRALGDGWAQFAEINPTKPLLNGRGASQFSAAEARHPGRSFGRCVFVASPMVRYDGLVSACCNEGVIMGLGPERLRQPTRSKADMRRAAAGFRADPFLRAIGNIGLGALTADDRFADLAERPFTGICQLCWEMFDRLPRGRQPDRLLEASALLQVAR